MERREGSEEPMCRARVLEGGAGRDAGACACACVWHVHVRVACGVRVRMPCACHAMCVHVGIRVPREIAASLALGRQSVWPRDARGTLGHLVSHHAAPYVREA
eukprot:scaffold22077_cov70-Phaeocystis_antarctica.AAC.1